MPRYSLRTLLIVVIVAAVSLAVARVAMKAIRPSLVYEMLAEFSELPESDEPFQQWVRDQPGVFRAYVNRDANAIRIVWGMSRDLSGNPQLPDFKKHFERFGYRDLKRYEPIP